MTTPTNGTQTGQAQRPGRRDGTQTELLFIGDVLPGHAAALRDFLTASMGPDMEPGRRQGTRDLGTVHNYRATLLDNDSRFLFASVFDGTWDDYIDDFGANPFFVQGFDNGLQHVVEGYRGFNDPSTKEWIVAHQTTATAFTSAYPDLTVKQILKQQRLSEAFQAVLDSPEFQAALKDPANAALVAAPAFQQLLDEAAS
jgi:hypothetical protein